MRIKIAVYLLFVLVFLGIWLERSFKIYRLEWEKERLRNKLLEKVEVVKKDSLTLEAYARELKEKDRKIKELITMVAYWKEIALSGEATEEVVDSSRVKVEFSFRKGSIWGKGYTLTNPPEYWLEIHREPVEIRLTLKETEEGLKVLEVHKSDPDLIFSCVDVAVRREKEIVFRRWMLGIGINWQREMFVVGGLKIGRLWVGGVLPEPGIWGGLEW